MSDSRLTDETRWGLRCGQVQIRQEQFGGLLYDMQRHILYELNRTAFLAIRKMTQPVHLADLVSAVLLYYPDQDVTQVRRDIAGLVSCLEEAGLVDRL